MRAAMRAACLAAVAATNIALGGGALCISRAAAQQPNVLLRPCDGSDDQEWTFENDNIQSKSEPPVCLQVVGEDPSTRSTVDAGSCNNQPAQGWAQTKQGGLATRMDEALCLDAQGDRNFNGSALQLHACDAENELAIGPSAALLQQRSKDVHDDNAAAMTKVREKLNKVWPTMQKTLTGEDQLFKTALLTAKNEIDLTSSTVKRKHEQNKKNWYAAVPLVENTLAQAKPISSRTQALQLGSSKTTALEFEKGKMRFTTGVTKIEGQFFKGYTSMLKKWMKGLKSVAKKSNKGMTDRDKKTEKFADVLWKHFQKLEKRADKVQGKMSDQIYEALDGLVVSMGDVEDMQNEVELLAEQKEGDVEGLTEIDTPNSLERVQADMEEAQEEFKTEIEERAEKTSEDWMGEAKRMETKLQQEQQSYLLAQMKQQWTPVKALRHMAVKVQNALKLLVKRVSKNAATSASRNSLELAKAVQYEKELDKLQASVERVKSEVYDGGLEAFKNQLDSGLYEIVAWGEKRLPADHAALESYVTKSEQLLQANADGEFAQVEGAGTAQLMDTWVRFLGQQATMRATTSRSQQGLQGLEKPIQRDREKLQTALQSASRITDVLHTLIQLPAKVAKGGTAMERAASDNGVKGTQAVLALAEQTTQKLNLMASQKKSDMTRVLEEGGKEIVNQASTTMHAIDSTTRNSEDEAKQIKYEMSAVDEKLASFELKLKHQTGELERNVPQRIRNFGDFFKQSMATNSYELDDMLTILTSFTKDAFQNANQNITELIEDGKKSVADYIQSEEQGMEADVLKVQEEMATTGVQIKAEISDQEAARKGLVKDSLGPVTAASDLAPKQAQASERFIANLMRGVGSIEQMQQQLQEARDAVTSKANDDTDQMKGWYQGRVSELIAKIGRKTAETIRLVNLALGKVQEQSNDRLNLNVKLVDEKLSKLGQTVKEAPSLLDQVLAPWKSGSATQAMSNWQKDLARMEAALDLADDAPRHIAKTGQEVMAAYTGLLAASDEQFRFDLLQSLKKVRTSIGQSKSSMSDSKRKVKARTEQVDQDSSLRIDGMLTRLGDIMTSTGLQKRRLDSGASSLFRLFSSHADGEKQTIRNMIGAQEDAKVRLRVEDQNNREAIRSADLRIERQGAASDRTAMKTESILAAALQRLDMGETQREIEQRLSFLTHQERGRSKQSEAEADDAITEVNGITMETLDAVEKSMRAFAAQNAELGAVASERQRAFGSVRDDYATDEEKVRGLLTSFHEVTSDLATKIQEEQDRVEAKHKKNEDNLALMTGMTAYSDADALDRVVKSVQDQAEMDLQVQDDVDTRVLPRMSYWRDGVTKVFEKLGMDLDLDAVHEKAKRMLAEELAQRQELSTAASELQAYLRAEVLTARLGQRSVDKHMRGVIDDIMARTDIDLAAKLRLIQKSRDQYNRKHMTVNQKIAQILAQQSAAQIRMSAMTGQIEAMLKRAREVAKPPWKVVNMFELSKKRDATEVVMNEVKTDMAKETQRTADAREKNVADSGINGVQRIGFVQKYSLLETEGATGNTNAKAVAHLQTAEQRLRAAAVQRDAEDAAWQSELDAAEGNLHMGAAGAAGAASL